MSESDSVDSTEVDARLDALGQLIGRYVVTIAPADTTSQRQAFHRARGEEHPSDADNVAILGFLAAQGRDFSAPSDEMADAVLAKLEEKVQELLDENLPPEHAQAAIGHGALEHIERRFNGDNELPMPELRPRTVARKGHGRIGVESGALRDGITHANVETRKVG